MRHRKVTKDFRGRNVTSCRIMNSNTPRMNLAERFVVVAACCLTIPASSRAQQVKPETERDFTCYVQSAEERMEARKTFLLADSDSALNEQLVRGGQIRSIPGNGANPHRIAGAQLYDWVASVFIPGAGLDRLIRMLQDYDRRAQYFPEIVSAAKLLCHTGDNHFRFTMRLKEPAVIDVESDVVWERVDPHRWRCHSYSTSVREIGKDHGYALRLYSYWRFAEVEKGVYVQGETITLSREFGGLTRAIGSMMGINPEKTLKRTLASMKESVLKPGAQFASSPPGLPECGAAFHPGGCAAGATR